MNDACLVTLLAVAAAAAVCAQPTLTAFTETSEYHINFPDEPPKVITFTSAYDCFPVKHHAGWTGLQCKMYRHLDKCVFQDGQPCSMTDIPDAMIMHDYVDGEYLQAKQYNIDTKANCVTEEYSGAPIGNDFGETLEIRDEAEDLGNVEIDGVTYRKYRHYDQLQCDQYVLEAGKEIHMADLVDDETGKVYAHVVVTDFQPKKPDPSVFTPPAMC